MKKHRFAYTSVGRASTHQPISTYTRLGQAESLTPALSGAVITAPWAPCCENPIAHEPW